MSIKEAAALIFLTVNTYSDIKSRSIMRCSVVVFGAAGVVMWILNRETAFAAMMLSLLPGLFLLGISKATKEALGYGDGIAVLILGVYTGFKSLVGVLMTAMLLAALWAGILLVRRQKGSHEFPFLPFLLLGYLGGLWL